MEYCISVTGMSPIKYEVSLCTLGLQLHISSIRIIIYCLIIKKMWAVSLDLVPRQNLEKSGTLILGNKGLQTEVLFTSSTNFVTC